MRVASKVCLLTAFALGSVMESDAWTATPSMVYQPARAQALRALYAVQGADIEQPPVEGSMKGLASAEDDPSPASSTGMLRGKVNEIDYCIAPADVSLSRSYDIAAEVDTSTLSSQQEAPVSMTRALNNASNRAVRRILLARSWPSAEALNESLRQVIAAEKAREAAKLAGSTAAVEAIESAAAKCTVPRPILNVLTRRRRNREAAAAAASSTGAAASTVEKPPSPRSRTDAEYVADQLKAFQERYGDFSGYQFAESYLESILMLATTGVESPRVTDVLEAGVYDEAYKRIMSVLASVGAVLEPDPVSGRTKIASKLVNQDICLSMMDKIRLQQKHSATSKSNGAPALQVVEADKEADAAEENGEESIKLTPEDLGGVLLSAEEPTMTRELNSLANIVQRALLFGGDQELLVLAETLDADRAPFVERWYPSMGGVSAGVPLQDETRAGVQFLNCLITLLRDCYSKGVVSDLDPPLPLLQSYANAYERLVASAVQLGSGYLRPDMTNESLTTYKPRNAQEQLGKFAVWESTFRGGMPKDDVSAYPEDLVGSWEVRDEISGETIGMTVVKFDDDGQVKVAPPLEGLRWRLDPGPTHLDTCTFQVLSSDGTILQYRGFIDRGARLEARFSKRPTKIGGSVMFQMREGGSADYYKDILPINYKTGTTKFVMTKKVDGVKR